MLVFNEGLPRSGKSYDAVKFHILPAIKAGRKIFARINGLDHEKIAAHMGLPVERVRELLVVVTSAEVKTMFVALRNLETGEWCIADELKNALFIVDECHGFYVAGREAINPAIEEFFALCGQNGMDGVLMSQWYRRVHSSVRARIERKNVFQKLTAVGLTGKYKVERWHTTSPDRFIKVNTETFSYDKTIYPLYHGYAPGADNVAVYKSGGRTVWYKIGMYAVFVLPMVGVAFFVFTRFFGPHSSLIKEPPPHAVAMASASALGPTIAVAPGAVRGAVGVPVHARHAKMSGTQAYVFDLADKGRPRLAGVITGGTGQAHGLVEWRDGSGGVSERLNFAQLRDMGVTVEVHTYGVRLVVDRDSLVVTSWPLAELPPVSSDGGQAGTSAPVALASNRGATTGDGANWPSREVGGAYVPPELAVRPVASNYNGHAGG